MTTPTMRLLAWAEQTGPAAQRDITAAITLAQRAHRGQFRRSGDPYIEHLVAVALILAEHGADSDTVTTAVLHNLRYATSVQPVDVLRAEFGSAVVDLLVAFTEIERAGMIDITAATDRRALQIKVADRLHNMRTICHVDPSAQQGKSTHTRQVMAPLARALGMVDIGAELDELATSTLRVHDAARSATSARPVTRPAFGVRLLRGALQAGGLLLPAPCRHRWLEEWDGELHAAADLTERLRFVTSVLFGVPRLAVTTRRRTER